MHIVAHILENEKDVGHAYYFQKLKGLWEELMHEWPILEIFNPLPLLT